jgi:hypothetical protein
VGSAQAEPLPDEEVLLREALALFRLMAPATQPGEVEAEYWNGVAAFFSAEHRQVTILDRGSPLDEPGAVILLVHELVHALQAARFEGEPSGCCATYDESLAFRGLLEGEAELYQDLALVYGYGDDPDEVAWDAIFQSFESSAWAAARRNPSPYVFAQLDFPYAFGGDYVNDAYRAGGNAAVRSLSSAPPGSTREILTGYGATPPENGIWRENPEEVGSPELPEEFEFVANVRLGAFLYEIFESKWRVGTFADSGFLGDVFNVFRETETFAIVGAWRLRFESEQQMSVVAGLVESQSGLGVERDGRDLVIWASSDQSLLPALRGVAWSAAVTPERDDAAEPASALPEMPHCPRTKRSF